MKTQAVLIPLVLALLEPAAVAAAGTPAKPVLPMQRIGFDEEPFQRARPLHDRPANTRDQDTIWYGGYQVIGGEYYARSSANIADVMWTFDRGDGPTNDPNVIYNGEGWRSRDLTINAALYFRVIDASLNLGQGVSAPIIAGTKSLWIGADKPQADDLCWGCGSGYGNNWCQRVVSEALSYNGTGSVTLSFKYFNKSEPCFDGTQVYLRRHDTTELLLNPVPPGGCPGNPGWENTGGFTDSIGHYTRPATYSRVIQPGEIGEAQEVRIVLEFKSDGGYSDEDCNYPTTWGPFACDDVRITGGGINRSYNFETGLQGWEPGPCVPRGNYVGIADLGCYTILDPCQCTLSGNVIEMHADECDYGVHPVGQHVWVESPICDFGDSNPKTILTRLDIYGDMPKENGVLIRPGWKYYPYTCEITGAAGWSPLVAGSGWYFFAPHCWTEQYLATPGFVPPESRKVIAILELLADCSAFGITNCTGITNFTPIFDNIAVGRTAPPADAPQVSISLGCTFQDVGSYPSVLLDPRAPGPANIARDMYRDNPDQPDVCGDSLVVVGPNPTDPDHRWESRLWWRVARRAPLQSDRANGSDTRYKIWRDRVADGKRIDRPYRPEFTFGWMDSVQVGPAAYRDTFQSTFRESDDDFVGEGNPENDMIWDDVLFPGTRIDYFITSNYIRSPSVLYYLPDTTGSYFGTFEILPGLRTARVSGCGQGGSTCVFQPATLLIGGNAVVQNALATILNGYPPCLSEDGCPIPEDRNWDRYDQTWSGTNFDAPFARGPLAGSNNGMTLNQVFGYRAILLLGSDQDADYALFDQWLSSPLCESNTSRQVFLASGPKIGEAMASVENGQAFMRDVLGATLFCDAFNGFTEDPNCGAEEPAFCVRVLPITGGPFGTETDIDGWGSGCPPMIGYNVFSTYGTGVGNRFYLADGGAKEMEYAEVVNENLGPDANWRTVLDGVGWPNMTQRNAGGSGADLCPDDMASHVAAAIAEMGAALKWGFGVSDYTSIPKLANVKDLATCQGTWGLPSEAEDAAAATLVNRLYQNEPNPFNPRTTIHFSTAREGRVEVMVYEVGGRLVRKLADERLAAGIHSLVWDGRNDGGAKVGSGIYWVQMKTGSFVSNRKLVVLK